MKTVRVVHYGCNLISDQLADEIAEQLKKKLEAKGLACYTQDVAEDSGKPGREPPHTIE